MEATGLLTILWRGLRKRCPQCGKGSLFRSWHEVDEACLHCGCEFQKREGDCWAFMYMTTAFLTGSFFVVMLLYRPADLLLGRIGFATGGLLVLGLSLPYRKGVALAIDYFLETRFFQ